MDTWAKKGGPYQRVHTMPLKPNSMTKKNNLEALMTMKQYSYIRVFFQIMNSLLIPWAINYILVSFHEIFAK